MATDAQPSAGATVHRTCPSGKVAIRIGKKHARTVCMPVRKLPKAGNETASETLFRGLAHRLRIGPRHHRNAHHLPALLTRPALARAEAKVLAVERRLQAAHPLPIRLTVPVASRAARPATVTRNHAEKPISTDDGFVGKATLDESLDDPDPGSTSPVAYESTMVGKASKGALTQIQHEHEKLSLGPCPSVDGEVPGTFDWSMSKTVEGKLPGGGTASLTQSTQVSAKVLGHTTDKGMVKDFDVDMVYQTITQGVLKNAAGKVVETDAPNLWTLHMTRKHLHLGKAFDEVIKGGDLGGSGDLHLVSAVGPGGSWSGVIPQDDLSVAQDALLKLGLVALKSDPTFYTLQGAWQDGACIAMDFTSSDVSLSPHLDFDGHPNGGQVTTMTPGQVAHLTSHLKAVRVRKLASGTFTASLYRGGASPGTVSPTSGTYTPTTHAFTYTAPSDSWTSPTDTVDLTVEMFSHQGRAAGYLTISPQGQKWRLVYTHASDGDPTFSYAHYSTFDADGTVVVHHHLALSGSANLTLDAARASGSGTGAVTWQRHTWSTDDDDTENAGQDPSVRCEIDYNHALTAAQPGTLTVKSITLGPAGTDGIPTITSLDVVIAGVSETWQWTETQKAGPCPGVNSSGTEHDFLNQLTNDYYEGAPGVTEGPPSDSSVELRFDGTGWQTSQGGLTKTLSSSYQPDFYNDPPQGAPVPWTDTFRLEPVPSS